MDSSNIWDPPVVQWVMKVTKLCNLRCKYCYEYPYLSDKAHMQLHQLEAMFINIASFYKNKNKRMDFVWHGGEPTLLGKKYYQDILELQDRVLTSEGIEFTNSVQTNLVKLNDDVIWLFKNFFSHIGVSLDLFGGQRIYITGKDSQKTVLENMQKLKDLGIRFGCITVLSKATVNKIKEIYEFYEEIDTSFRLLPIYRTGYEGQQENNALSGDEIVDSFISVFDKWMHSDSNIQVRPIQDYIIHAIRAKQPEGRRYYYDKSSSEVLFIVDTDGCLYSNADAYNSKYAYGNIFNHNLSLTDKLFTVSESINESKKRMNHTCKRCDLFGACSGFFMGEATPEQRIFNNSGKLECVVPYRVQNHILQYLDQIDLSTDELSIHNNITGDIVDLVS